MKNIFFVSFIMFLYSCHIERPLTKCNVNYLDSTDNKYDSVVDLSIMKTLQQLNKKNLIN